MAIDQQARQEGHRILDVADFRVYAATVVRVLKAGFGADKRICVTLFHEGEQETLPVCLVAVHLDWPDDEEFRCQFLATGFLEKQLQDLGTLRLLGGGVCGVYKRGCVRVATVYLARPARLRFWSRSMALADADEVAGTVMCDDAVRKYLAKQKGRSDDG